jgi:CheY-like chemotaxis protein
VPKPNTILIADDNDDDVSFLLQGFADIRVTVIPTRVRDGDSVVALFTGGAHFRLIVLDYYLPKKNAAEIMRSLLSRGVVIPAVVVLSSYLSPEQRLELEAAGVRKILEKPHDLGGFAILAGDLARFILSQ